jgi:hypothetical protein
MMGRVIVDAGPTATSAIAPQHVGRHAAFIQKREPGGINRGGELAPVRPGNGDVGPVLFGRAQGFF